MVGTATNWQEWTEQGISVIPVRKGSKVAAMPWKRWQTQRPPEPLVRQWFGSGEYNIGLLMGVVSGGLFCLDHDSVPAWARWKRDHRDLETLTTITPRPGRHDYFRLDKVLTSMYFDGLDVKATGYVLAPNSLHPSGKRYKGNGKPILTIDSLDQVLDMDHLQTQYKVVGSASNTDIEPNSAQSGIVQPPTNTECTSHIAMRRGDLIGSIRRALPVLALVSQHTEFVTPSSQCGRWFVCRCPFHSPDRHPSFWVDNVRGLCSCFKPECRQRQPGGKPMDTINLYGRLHDTTNRQAILALAAELGV